MIHLQLRPIRTLSLALTLAALTLGGCGGDGPRVDVDEDPIASDWAEIQERDTLVALTQFNSTGYFIYRGEPMGLEYELLQAFAEANDLAFRPVVLENREELIDRLNSGEGDVAAARLFPSQIESEYIEFSDALYQTRPAIVQRTGAAQAADIPPVVREDLDSIPDLLVQDAEPVEVSARLIQQPADLAGRELFIPNNPALYERLLEVEDSISGDIEIVEVEGDIRTEAILRRLADGRIPLAAAPENLARLSDEYYENLTVRPALGEPYEVAWGVRQTSPELLNQLNGWLETDETQALVEELYQKYFVDRQGYRERSESGYLTSETGRISEFDGLLRQAARGIGWDWRLLAAQTFQESKFDPRAQSWAGAMGLMQLMPATAREVGVSSAYDPEENVAGGTRYLERLNGMWEDEIPDPTERLKFVLASYNTGRGHVQDAQRLAEKNGGNPQDWDDVAYWLLQKSKREVYTDPVVKFGFARGLEPVTYVAKILDRFENYRQMAPEENA